MLEAIRVKTSVKNDLPKAKNGCKLEEIRSFSSFLFFCIKKRLFSYEKRRFIRLSLYMIQSMTAMLRA
ncbi:hypothetical protein CHCC15290_0987 [Bacillus licheniformis]|nr:hypothetical protein C1T27_13120 [Bacillus licheniformis]KUL10893.1 hypothetical protein LI17339_11665 [Bacillus licheniformis LMG 17339]MBC9088076.1 hypothetical protein [Bacillus sp. Y1]NBB44250.1 hypothetical protein [Bacillus sp. y1(2019)]NYV79737.1 hypothetical protein [Bacillus sp. Gen2]